MTENELQKLFQDVIDGKTSISNAVSDLKSGPLKTVSSKHFTFDSHRRLRQGFAEVIFAEPKSVEHILQIAEKVSSETFPVLFTRLLSKQAEALTKKYPSGRYNSIGRTFIFNAPIKKEVKTDEPYVAIFSGGTSDAPVVEEAADVCLAFNIPFVTHNDVGVAGLHRLLNHIDVIQNATAIVVAAGMEGALPSVIGGIADAPIFAVPTSVGYGTSFSGVSALLGMLNSCASGVTVSNIDNGFSAAYSACQVVVQVKKRIKKG